MGESPNASCDISNTIDLVNNITATSKHFTTNPLEQQVANILWPSLLLFGLFSNISFLYVVAKVPFMRTITNAYLCTLAVADILHLLSSITDQLLRYNWSLVPGDDTHKGLLGCIAIDSINTISYLESAMLVSLVSLERFLAICFPLKHRYVQGARRTGKLILTSWVISLLLMIMVVLNYSASIVSFCVIWPNDVRYSNYPNQIKLCSAHRNISGLSHQILFPITWNAIWLFIAAFNIFMYVGIMRRLKHRESDPALHGSHNARQNATNVRNQVEKMLVVNGAVFFGAWVFNATRLVFVIAFQSGHRLVSPETEFVFNWVTKVVFVLNSSINPLVYSVTNARYREAFKKAFGM